MYRPVAARRPAGSVSDKAEAELSAGNVFRFPGFREPSRERIFFGSKVPGSRVQRSRRGVRRQYKRVFRAKGVVRKSLGGKNVETDRMSALRAADIQRSGDLPALRRNDPPKQAPQRSRRIHFAGSRPRALHRNMEVRRKFYGQPRCGKSVWSTAADHRHRRRVHLFTSLSK